MREGKQLWSLGTSESSAVASTVWCQGSTISSDTRNDSERFGGTIWIPP